MKVKVECTDPHSPQGIFEFDEKLAKQLVKRPHYKMVNGGTVKVSGEIEVPKQTFYEDMEEKDIKQMIKDSNIPVKYNISNDSKKDKLKELENLGYEVIWRGE